MMSIQSPINHWLCNKRASIRTIIHISTLPISSGHLSTLTQLQNLIIARDYNLHLPRGHALIDNILQFWILDKRNQSKWSRLQYNQNLTFLDITFCFPLIQSCQYDLVNKNASIQFNTNTQHTHILKKNYISYKKVNWCVFTDYIEQVGNSSQTTNFISLTKERQHWQSETKLSSYRKDFKLQFFSRNQLYSQIMKQTSTK